jgi:hypothetical protein
MNDLELIHTQGAVHQPCADCTLLPSFTYNGLVAECVVGGFYFAFSEMYQDEEDVITARRKEQKEMKILGSSVMESKR